MALDQRTATDRQRSTWETGDFNVISRLTMPMSERLVQTADPHAGQRVLDLACGSGNAALVAARRHCAVTGVDYAPSLLENARVRAEAEGLDIEFCLGDAQALPFPDESFDVVLSAIGVMFAPNQEGAAREILRVCRPGGVIGLASWMPEGFGGDFFAAHARYTPPPAGTKPPTRWGTEAGLQELFGSGARLRSSQRRSCRAYFHSTRHALELHRNYFGPTMRALESLDEADRENLERDLEEVFTRYDRATDRTAIVEYEYHEAIVERL